MQRGPNKPGPGGGGFAARASGGRTRPLESADEDELLERALGNLGESPKGAGTANAPLPSFGIEGLSHTTPALPPHPHPPRPVRPGSAASPGPVAPLQPSAPPAPLVPPPAGAVASFMENLPTSPVPSPFQSPLAADSRALLESLEAVADEEGTPPPLGQPPRQSSRAPKIEPPTPTEGGDSAPAIPLWAVVMGLGALLAVAAGLFFIVRPLDKLKAPAPAASTPHAAAVSSAEPAAAEASAQAPAAGAEPQPSATAEEPAAPAAPVHEVPSGMLGRATTGDAEAIAALEKKSALSADEALALHSGRAARELADARAVGESIMKDPAAAPKDAIAKLRTFASDSRTAGEALAVMARLGGPMGPDLLYEVWTSTPKRTDSTTLAEALLRHPTVRARASKALLAAIDLRSATECDAARAALPRVVEQGDQRSLAPLARLMNRRGCGPNKKQDCWACLHADKGKAIADAINTVRKRAAPKY